MNHAEHIMQHRHYEQPSAGLAHRITQQAKKKPMSKKSNPAPAQASPLALLSPFVALSLLVLVAVMIDASPMVKTSSQSAQLTATNDAETTVTNETVFAEIFYYSDEWVL